MEATSFFLVENVRENTKARNGYSGKDLEWT
jgi:hypothetical protein